MVWELLHIDGFEPEVELVPQLHQPLEGLVHAELDVEWWRDHLVADRGWAGGANDWHFVTTAKQLPAIRILTVAQPGFTEGDDLCPGSRITNLVQKPTSGATQRAGKCAGASHQS